MTAGRSVTFAALSLGLLGACASGSATRLDDPHPNVLAATPPNSVAARSSATALTPRELDSEAPAAFAKASGATGITHQPEPADCAPFAPGALTTLEEPGGPKKQFSVHGYAARSLRVESTEGGQHLFHCLTVAWPKGSRNSAGQWVGVADALDDAWLRVLENSLARLPWEHVRLVQRIVIDNRPKEHGIAPFDRQSPDDARDGSTIWLHEHLFREPNHWALGNYGTYWSYHVNEDAVVIDDAPSDHDLFSPVLLHEIGHLVMYRVANAHLPGPAAASNVECAQTCKERGDCHTLSATEREQHCISPYCAPFRFEASTENWAEQYRLFYQSSVSRKLLGVADSPCLKVLAGHESVNQAPWQRGLPDMQGYRRSRWDSCGKRACKQW